jgi:glyoxylase-like metal-dependent hydrolase (beta-lactamase superfamily II)
LIRFAWGGLRLTVLDAGSLWLDGGAMFGVVPKPLWSRHRPADETNRIELGMNLLLVEDGRRVTLVDSGAGIDWDDRWREIYRLDPRSPAEILEPVGMSPPEIDRVVNSHLHFDHAGGNTRRDEAGAWVPSFPSAEYVVQRGEVETARWDNERTRGSYRRECFEPLLADGRLRLVEGDVALDPHLSVRVAPGHTPYMQVVLVGSEEGTVLFLADLVPTATHLPYPWIMGYDLEPLKTLATKKRLLSEAAAGGWRVVFEHDRELPLAVLAERDGKLAARPVESIS